MTYDPVDTNDDGTVDADVDNESVSTGEADIGGLKAGLMSDPHWYEDSGQTDISYIPSLTEIKANFDTFIDDMNSWGADYVHVNGDVVHRDADSLSEYKTWVQNCRNYLEETGGSDGNGLNCPVFYSIGNHELKWLGGSDWGAFPFDSVEDTWHKHEVGPYDVITLKTASENGPGPHTIEQQQLEDVRTWLEESDRPKIVHMHIPTFLTTTEDYDEVENGEKLDKLLTSDPTVRAVHYGHIHHSNPPTYLHNRMDRRGWIHTTTPNVLEGPDMSAPNDSVAPYVRLHMQSKGFGVAESSYSQSDTEYSLETKWPVGTVTPSESPIGQMVMQDTLWFEDNTKIAWRHPYETGNIAWTEYDDNTRKIRHLVDADSNATQVYGEAFSGQEEMTVEKDRVSFGKFINLSPQPSPPSGPEQHDIYLDDGTNTASGNEGLRRYDGSAWVDIAG